MTGFFLSIKIFGKEEKILEVQNALLVSLADSGKTLLKIVKSKEGFKLFLSQLVLGIIPSCVHIALYHQTRKLGFSPMHQFFFDVFRCIFKFLGTLIYSKLSWLSPRILLFISQFSVVFAQVIYFFMIFL